MGVIKDYIEVEANIEIPKVKMGFKMDIDSFGDIDPMLLNVYLSVILRNNFGATSLLREELMEKENQEEIVEFEEISNIDIPEGVTVIQENTFVYCSSLESIVIPEGVTEIKQYTFKNCDEMTKVTIPEGVTSIAAYAFNSCAQLVDVEFATECKLETIGNYAFADCVNLSAIQLPTTVTSIGNYAFSGCISIAKINSETDGEMLLPENVTTIGEYAFQNLELMTKVVVPDTVTSIGPGAFKGCNAIEDITLPFVGASADATYYDAVFGYIFGYINANSYDDGNASSLSNSISSSSPFARM